MCILSDAVHDLDVHFCVVDSGPGFRVSVLACSCFLEQSVLIWALPHLTPGSAGRETAEFGGQIAADIVPTAAAPFSVQQERRELCPSVKY